jgi:hypothetical protein
MSAVFGDTVIVCTVLVTATLSVAAPLTPLTAAVTVADPPATAVTSPDEFTVATAVDEELQAAVALTFAVELSL